MRISDVKFASELGEVRERRAAMAARVARLEAEAQGRSSVTFPDDLAPEHTAPEMSVFEARARRLDAGSRCAPSAGNQAHRNIGDLDDAR